MNLGDAFLMPHPFQNYDHLWFVISDPGKHFGTFLIANTTTDRQRAGGECPLGPSDHPWIREPCFMSFADALEITPPKAAYMEKLTGSLITTKRSLEPETIAKIVEAANRSVALPVAYKKYL